MLTDYHAKYYAHELSRVGSNGEDRLDRALFDACVDLNPHQIEAALFAMRSPLSKGVLLADEVGLGKTVEAGLVLCQKWAEQQRHLLVICPASLRKQWSIELGEKFHLPTVILDAKTYREEQRSGRTQPFATKSVIICSMHFAATRSMEIIDVPWDLIVIDEAHKLRGAYRQSNRIGQAIRAATSGRRKVLLTATPLQNSLLELYGLTSIIDDELFGDLASFKAQYCLGSGDLSGLRDRLRSFCLRTLRNQVLEYVRYTRRIPLTQPFKPNQQEQDLYTAVSNYLQRPGVYGLPASQRHLLTLLIRKFLASSARALAGTLEKLKDGLLKLREKHMESLDLVDRLIETDEIDPDLLDEVLEDEDELAVTAEEDSSVPNQEELPPSTIDLAKLDAEIEELERYIGWANAIGVDTKTRALVMALRRGFEEMDKLGAARKAVVFTESRRTQLFIKDFLETNGFMGRVATFNGTNKEPEIQSIYETWQERNRETGKLSGSRDVDVRTAIIEHFRDDAEVLIATEAAAEGINLQFCSLVINYDLPWNPQRIEQRIGRCHRYGQLHDVVVINFLNERNEADRRVYELLASKFQLFHGVFGASDEVLGSIESGVDFERRILAIYQSCRSPEEIADAFAKLQADLDAVIQVRMRETRQLLLEHFDEEVHDRLRVNLSGTQDRLDRIGRMFWLLTRHMLTGDADFLKDQAAFDLLRSPIPAAHTGRYRLVDREGEAMAGEFTYRLTHPLGEHVIASAAALTCRTAAVEFDVSGHHVKVALAERLKGRSGWLACRYLSVDSYERQDFILFNGFTDDGTTLDQETCEKLFSIMGITTGEVAPPEDIASRLAAELDQHSQAALARNLEENNRHFKEQLDKLDKWAEDMELGLQRQLDDVKRRIRELQRQANLAPSLGEQASLREEINRMETQKRRLRQRVFDIEDEIDQKRQAVTDALRRRLAQKSSHDDLFFIRWTAV